jgi:hypothetical protein
MRDWRVAESKLLSRLAELCLVGSIRGLFLQGARVVVVVDQDTTGSQVGLIMGLRHRGARHDKRAGDESNFASKHNLSPAFYLVK